MLDRSARAGKQSVGHVHDPLGLPDLAQVRVCPEKSLSKQVHVRGLPYVFAVLSKKAHMLIR